MIQILDGKAVAEAMAIDLERRVQRLSERDIVPTLAVLRLGRRPEDLQYEKAITRQCARVGVALRVWELPEDSGTEAVAEAVCAINGDRDIHGCLLMRPFPESVQEELVCELLSSEKDVDGIGSRSLAGVFTGRGEGYCPCTAQACLEILDYYRIPLEGKRAVVIGRSLVVGKPLAMLLTARDATVTLCHSKTRGLAELCRGAELLVSAAGCAGLVDRDAMSPGQVILDVGVNMDEQGQICGDVVFAQAAQAAAITPVPGGVGCVTTTVLCKHVIEAAESRIERK